MKRLKLQFTVLLAAMSMMVACKSNDSNPAPNPGPGVQTPNDNNNNGNNGNGDRDPLGPTDDSKRKVAITVDDLPFLATEGMSPQEETDRFLKVLDALAEHRISADGFAVGNMMDFFEKEFFDIWKDRGHRIHNHTFSHLDLHQVDAATFQKDIEDNEAEIGPWMGELRFFRFPYLDRGDTAEKKQQTADYLKQKGYTVAPVTIESSDWYFNDEYNKALAANDQAAADQIVTDYVAYVRRQAKIYQMHAIDKVGRDIKHILILHMNVINSDHLDKVLTMLKNEDFGFVTLEEALKDPVYAEQDEYIGTGVTWLQRIYGDPQYSEAEVDFELGIDENDPDPVYTPGNGGGAEEPPVEDPPAEPAPALL